MNFDPMIDWWKSAVASQPRTKPMLPQAVDCSYHIWRLYPLIIQPGTPDKNSTMRFFKD